VTYFSTSDKPRQGAKAFVEKKAGPSFKVLIRLPSEGYEKYGRKKQ
jgi:hypothetical protein